MAQVANMNIPILNANMTSGAPDTANRTPMSGFDTTTSYEQSRRQVSSVVVSEQFIGEMPESGGIRYVEVPVIEEVIKHVPRREVVEVEKIVPKYEVEYVERVVEVPQIHYVDRHVERPQFQEVIRTVAVKQVQEIPREVIRHIPKVEYVQVEKIVEVPGQVIEVPKPYTVENKVPVKHFHDKNLPVVVAQTIQPVVVESAEVIDVDVYEYEPQVIPIDVHVAKPVASHLVAIGATQEMHQVVSVPAAQYNTILRSINTHLTGIDTEQLPYLREGHHVPFLANHEVPGTAAPAHNVPIHPAGTLDMHHIHLHNAQINTREVVTSGSMYQGGYYPTQTGSITGGETVSMASMAPPAVYPNVTTRDVESKSVKSHPSNSNYKSVKSRQSFAPSHTVNQHKRKGCQC